MHAARRRISNEKPIRSLDDYFLGWKNKHIPQVSCEVSMVRKSESERHYIYILCELTTPTSCNVLPLFTLTHHFWEASIWKQKKHLPSDFASDLFGMVKWPPIKGQKGQASIVWLLHFVPPPQNLSFGACWFLRKRVPTWLPCPTRPKAGGRKSHAVFSRGKGGGKIVDVCENLWCFFVGWLVNNTFVCFFGKNEAVKELGEPGLANAIL